MCCNADSSSEVEEAEISVLIEAHMVALISKLLASKSLLVRDCGSRC